MIAQVVYLQSAQPEIRKIQKYAYHTNKALQLINKVAIISWVCCGFQDLAPPGRNLCSATCKHPE